MAQPSFDISLIPLAVLRRLCFAFDVDGTLTLKDKTISPQTTRAIQAIFQAGGTAGVCTGRAYPLLPTYVLNQFNPTAMHVVGGGAQVVNQHGERLWGQELPVALIIELAMTALAHGSGYGFGIGKTIYASLERHAELRQLFPDSNVQEFTPGTQLIQAYLPMVIITGVTDQTRAAFEQYSDQIAIKEMMSGSGKPYFDVTAKGVTKSMGLRELARLRQTPVTEIITVGDNFNDLEMIEMSWGVAMGNAVPELKTKAKLVIGHNNEDGLAEFIMAVLEARKLLGL